MRERKRLDRGSSLSRICEVCGYDDVIDIHHDEKRKLHALCPNHHALITRGIKTLPELKSNPTLGQAVKPNRDTLRELRGLMNNISKRKQAFENPDDLLYLGPDIDEEREDWPDIDADGNLIPDF